MLALIDELTTRLKEASGLKIVEQREAITLFDRIKHLLPADVVWSHLTKQHREFFVKKARLLLEKEEKR